jgi:hypothetical protein
MESIVEDIKEIPEDSGVSYCVWALCYAEDEDCVDSYFIKEFTDPDEAVEYAKEFTIETFKAEYEKPAYDTTRLSIEVETVVEDPDNEAGGTMNIGTIYQRDLWLDGEYGSDEEATDYGDPIVAVGEDDYELLEDGILKLSAMFMKGFNKNDMIRVQFLGETDVDLLPYKIMSKVEYADGDYYHCELMI